MNENNTIKRINQYLLERYPIVWNTRILWMLLGTTAIHLLFFFWGFISVEAPSVDRYGYNNSAASLPDSVGVTMFSTAVSVVLLVLWLTQLFKNNGFKNFYPSKGTDLLQYFVSYLLIVFACTTFYLSHLKGFSIRAHSLFEVEDYERLMWKISLSISFYVSLWTSFCFSSWLFIFRITDLKSSLLTAVTLGLTGILIAMFSLFVGLSGSDVEFVIPYFILLIYFAILVLPHVMGDQMSKRAQAVCMNIAIIASVPMLLLVFLLISFHQEDGNGSYKKPFIETLGNSAHWILLLWGILFIFIYSKRIRSWKAMPEG